MGCVESRRIIESGVVLQEFAIETFNLFATRIDPIELPESRIKMVLSDSEGLEVDTELNDIIRIRKDQRIENDKAIKSKFNKKVEPFEEKIILDHGVWMKGMLRLTETKK